MSLGSDRRLLVRVRWPWRLVLFAVVAAVIMGLEQWLQTWLIPTELSDLAVRQLQASDLAAESLRTFEWAQRTVLPVITGGLIVVLGGALFVPLPRRWVKRLRRMCS